ncbi:PEP/pyruvate-binding domain-containing protein [Actinotalea solisilvae]|uniref:PEP/pyruvate-binding domain-containing protein n=1 Tax=Actinotalea solisilvae TaxID=2072922 RepID=UPI0018F2715F|nr:PEP/pyruvate-binding domain-containing protein [Actinotalea solisilvae]
MIVPLTDADDRCGGKAAALGALRRAGVDVPDGVVVLDPLGDEAWPGALEDALRALGDGPFAVRSSARGEDGAAASFAGQLATTLGVRTAGDVIREVRRVGASGSTARVAAYSSRTGHRVGSVVPVLVQVQVAAEVSGVLFTRHPVTGADEVVVEAAPGPGSGVVGGTVTPARWTVRPGRPGCAGDVVPGGPGDVVPGAPGDARPVLTTAQVLALAAMGHRVAALRGGPQDVEWVLAAGRARVLQSRPVTTGGGPRSATTDGPRSLTGAPIAVGTPASPGRATGPARVVGGLDELDRFGAGDVLVCRTTSPAWTPLLAVASAVVTETGGLLAHAAIVARELGIPAVLGVRGATTLLRDGQEVVVDGTRGTVAAAEGREVAS